MEGGVDGATVNSKQRRAGQARANKLGCVRRCTVTPTRTAARTDTTRHSASPNRASHLTIVGQGRVGDVIGGGHRPKLALLYVLEFVANTPQLRSWQKRLGVL